MPFLPGPTLSMYNRRAGRQLDMHVHPPTIYIQPGTYVCTQSQNFESHSYVNMFVQRRTLLHPSHSPSLPQLYIPAKFMPSSPPVPFVLGTGSGEHGGRNATPFPVSCSCDGRPSDSCHLHVHCHIHMQGTFGLQIQKQSREFFLCVMAQAERFFVCVLKEHFAIFLCPSYLCLSVQAKAMAQRDIQHETPPSCISFPMIFPRGFSRYCVTFFARVAK